MKIEFEKLPIYDPRPDDTNKRTQAMMVQEGRDAYTCGLPDNHCLSQLIDSDMRIDWRNGWRWEKKLHAERTPKCTCEGCRKYG